MATPQGIVQIFNVTAQPPVLLLNVNLDPNGNFSLSDTSLPVGTYDVQASYLGQGAFPPSQSQTTSVTVNPPTQGTTTSLTVAPATSNQGDTVVFSGSVTQP